MSRIHKSKAFVEKTLRELETATKAAHDRPSGVDSYFDTVKRIGKEIANFMKRQPSLFSSVEINTVRQLFDQVNRNRTKGGGTIYRPGVDRDLDPCISILNLLLEELDTIELPLRSQAYDWLTDHWLRIALSLVVILASILIATC